MFLVATMEHIHRSIMCLLLYAIGMSHGFISVTPVKRHYPITSSGRFMGDHSSATRFKVGDSVVVIDDVMKMGRNLKGLDGTVVETWEKCDVDPTCCCAEWVDEGLSVHVKFNVPVENADGNVRSLLANDIFVHYFAESELEISNKNQDDRQSNTSIQTNSNDDEPQLPFDGMSCKAFKLDKLKLGQQAQRIAAFEAEKKKMSQ